MKIKPSIWTIGYGPRDVDTFLSLLKANRIEYLVDVRSEPYSRHKPEFNRRNLQSVLNENSIRYVFMGDTLGGRPDDASLFSDGKPDFGKVAAAENYRSGIERLLSAAQQELRLGVMCSEAKPENCHRSKWIGRTLVQEGVQVHHIDENGALVSQQDLVSGEKAVPETIPLWQDVKQSNPPVPQPERNGKSIPAADPAETLRDVFGYPAFRPLQFEIIQNILNKRDSLAIMATGSGKSLCFQLPAVIQDGITVVASPLISLMEDQVVQLREWGIQAVFLNSTLDYGDYLDVTRSIKSGQIKIVYAAPETLLRPDTISMLEKANVDCLVIDEAHCISEWGHDFRPEYRRLADLRTRLPGAVTLAVTATATDRVRNDIMRSLGIEGANTFVSSFDRPNLHLAVADRYDGLRQAVSFLDTHKGEAGIIYCTTRATVDTLSEELLARGHPVLPYHAGMSTQNRRENQQRFRLEEGLIVVATIAFGMGIDKPDVRFILHYDLPKNLESYYQQIGRAGRDGLPSDCLLLYTYGDIRTIRYFMPTDDPDRRRGEEQRLQTFLLFVEASSCRRPPLLKYFSEAYPEKRCGNCDRCEQELRASEGNPGESKSTALVNDLSEPARLFMETIKDTREIFGAAHIIDVLRGSKSRRVLDFKHDRLKTYDQGIAYSKDEWRRLSGIFQREGLVRRTAPHGSLQITDAGTAILNGKTFLTAEAGIAQPARRPGLVEDYDKGLFERLRSLRSSLAADAGVPPYLVFNDRTLIEMSTRYPQTIQALGRIFGVGQQKTEHYGDQFLEVIVDYCRENEIKALPEIAQPISLPSLAGRQRTEKVLTLFEAGKNLQEIAAEMGFTNQTILKHLKKASEQGKNIRPDGLLAASALPQETRTRVLSAFRELGTAYLKPVYDALEETVPYEELHLWRFIFELKENSPDP